MNNGAIIEIKHLTKKFKNSPEDAVKDISFTVGQNEIYGLLGPNGAGKTTTLSVLCGLFPPTSGSVLIDGKNIQKDPADIRKIVGIVPQDIALYSSLTAKENLDFYGHMYGLKGKDLKNKIAFWLEKLDLTDAANRQVCNFSGGMKRRVNLIAGILHQPKILFLDEPTVGVDVQSRSVIIGHLKDLNKAGTTIIYTSHLMEEAENFCTYVSIIDHGKILAGDSPAALISSFKGSGNLEDVFLQLTDTKPRD
ncbi:MAG: ABC transporter ATP-binding protein [Bacteroidota bacterium]|nr:ABC transporter ATP-binding protein [Bacteroidota bacterium]MDP4251244.1 ABC transporter ATP-binding protein [Bacteroidota bacterium]